MNLDIKERLFLSNQFRILEKLYPDESDYYARNRIAIEDGYELHYDWLTEHISKGLSKEECSFVIDVLDLYTILYRSYNNLNTPPKEVKPDQLIFPGFDGNHETKYMSYTRYFIDDLGRFDHIKTSTNGYYNSHSPKVDQYKKMVEIWTNMPTNKRYDLSGNKISEIVNYWK